MDVGDRFQKEVSLAPWTTFKIGGPAERFFVASTTEELVEALDWARSRGMPCLILGGGSNVLVSDQGFRGLVIKNETHDLEVVEENGDFITVHVASGYSLAGLIQQLLGRGYGGLWKFAGIPGTVGGAVAVNAHGRDQFFGDSVVNCRFWKDGVVSEENQFPRDGAVLLDVALRIPKGCDITEARQFYKMWLVEKAQQQPAEPSAGCVFKNLIVRDQQRLGLSTNSVGYFIDRVLGLKGQRIGDAAISPKHANFIVNIGKATAEEVLSLIRRIEDRALDHHVKLEREINLIGDFSCA